MTEENIKQNFASNLAFFRKSAGMTQLELAQKLNYSDKAVSKWERGESIPDVVVLSSIAELFEVTVDEIIGSKRDKKPFFFRNKVLTTLLSVSIVWVIATLLYFVFELIAPDLFRTWLFFIYAIPISAVVLVVFTHIWWNKFIRFLSTSLLIWSIPLFISLTFPYGKIWLIFAVGGAVQVMAIFWYLRKENIE